jgi:GNAT superfamily N-acetyltransferase
LTPTIRRAGVGDLALIHQLLTEMAADEGAQIESTQDSLRQHGFGERPQFRTLLAEGDAALGLILFFPEYSTWRGKMGVFVQDLYLRKAARGSGLGRALLAAAFRDAADWDPHFLTLMVEHKNTSARGFYTRMGFTQRGKADPLILTGEGLAALNTP